MEPLKKGLKDAPVDLTSSLSPKTPGRDLEDMLKSLDRVPDVGMGQNFHQNFRALMHACHITPFLGYSGTSMSSKTPGRDLEDM